MRLPFRRASTAAFAVLLHGASICNAHSQPTVWFGDLSGRPALGEAAAESTARTAFARMRGRGAQAAIPKDAEPRVVFLTVAAPGKRAVVVQGSGVGVSSALEAALAALSRAAGVPSPAQAILRFDLVDRVRPETGEPGEETLDRKFSVRGLAFAPPIAFMADEIRSNRMIANGLMEVERANAYLEARAGAVKPYAIREGQQPQFTFTTRTWVENGGKVSTLFRGHTPAPALTVDLLRRAAEMGGAYLVRAVDAEGRFDYRYSPDEDASSPSYNLVRHAGAIYSLAELYAVNRDPKLKEAAERAARYLLSHARAAKTAGEQGECLVENGAVRLGANALAVVALVQYGQATGDSRFAESARRLARWMVSIQEPSGRFRVNRLDFESGKASDFESDYYPGEAALALARLAGADPAGPWLDAAAISARYLIAVRDKGLADDKLPADHWLLYALDELQRKRPDPLFVNHALRIAASIVRTQDTKHAEPDWAGTFGDSPRSTPAATRVEGLLAAARLAKESGHAAESASFLEAARKSVRFQLQMQWQPETSIFFANPGRALGGFAGGLYDTSIRIDYVQHNISSILALLSAEPAAR